jgi:hypothetical protein
MGFLAPALPYAIKGGAALLGGMLGKKAQAGAQKRSGEEQISLTGGQGAAGNLASTGASMTETGQATQRPATSYYDTLLRGNRAQMAQATAAPRAAITDVYRGAERSVERSGVQGAAKDVQTGELNRQRASQLSSLVTGVQPAAADALTGIGQQQTSTGVSASGTAGSIYGGLLGQGAGNRMYAREEGEKAGKGIGGLLFDVASGSFGGLGKKKPVLPSRQTVPNMSTWLPQ